MRYECLNGHTSVVPNIALGQNPAQFCRKPVGYGAVDDDVKKPILQSVHVIKSMSLGMITGLRISLAWPLFMPYCYFNYVRFGAFLLCYKEDLDWLRS